MYFSKYFYRFLFYGISVQGFCNPVGDGAGLLDEITDWNAGSSVSVEFTNSFGIENANRLPIFSNASFASVGGGGPVFVINGQGNTLGKVVGGLADGQSAGFFLRSGVTDISNLTFDGIETNGGNGDLTSCGGGGAAMGGALFLYSGSTANLSNVSFQNCDANGGGGGSTAFSGGGGGAGCASNGGNGGEVAGTVGGGGGGFYGNATRGGGGAGTDAPLSDQGGGNFVGANGGMLFGSPGGPGGGGAADLSDGGVFGGGGDGGFGGGGGGGSHTTSSSGGSGGNPFGGGGAAMTSSPGGFGGGGGSSNGINGEAGIGGFGGGGGRAFGGLTTPGGFGGGTGDATSAGSGGGFGGAIFLDQNTVLNINENVSFANNTARSTRGPNNGQSFGQDIFAISSAQMNFNHTNDMTLSAIEGNQGQGGRGTLGLGGLIKQGSGKLSINGNNTYTGVVDSGTHVRGGELHCDGSITTDVTIEDGAKLSGNLSILQDAGATNTGKVINHGTIAPGNGSVGTMTITGGYTQSSTGILEADITPTGNNADKIFISGNGDLDGTVRVLIGAGNYIAGTEYVLIDGVTTGVDKLTLETTGVNHNIVDVQLKEGSLILEILNTALFQNQTIDPNVAPVAEALSDITVLPNTELSDILEVLGTLSDEELNLALNKMSAANYASLEWIMQSNDSAARVMISDHLLNNCCEKRPYKNNFWLSAYGNFLNQDKFDNLCGFRSKMGGAMVGFDRNLGYFYLGTAAGYSYTQLNIKDFGGYGFIHNVFGALYKSFTYGGFTVESSAMGGAKFTNFTRRAKFSTIDKSGHTNFIDPFANVHLGLKLSSTCGKLCIIPFGNIDYHFMYRPAIKETGADPIGLYIQKHYSHFLQTELGANFKLIYEKEGGYIVPYIGGSWVKKFPLGNTNYLASFIGESYVMDTPTASSNLDFVSPFTGIQINSPRLSFIIGYKGEFSKKSMSNQVEAKLIWSF